MRLVFVPTQISPRFTGDSAMDWIVPPTSSPGLPRRLSGVGTVSLG